ncbi:hypothetical protein RE9416_16600 [Prescottella equi]|nr:hypothetical protein RE9416_16600 [Prescottella equi]
MHPLRAGVSTDGHHTDARGMTGLTEIHSCIVTLDGGVAQEFEPPREAYRWRSRTAAAKAGCGSVTITAEPSGVAVACRIRSARVV